MSARDKQITVRVEADIRERYLDICRANDVEAAALLYKVVYGIVNGDIGIEAIKAVRVVGTTSDELESAVWKLESQISSLTSKVNDILNARHDEEISRLWKRINALEKQIAHSDIVTEIVNTDIEVKRLDTDIVNETVNTDIVNETVDTDIATEDDVADAHDLIQGVKPTEDTDGDTPTGIEMPDSDDGQCTIDPVTESTVGGDSLIGAIDTTPNSEKGLPLQDVDVEGDKCQSGNETKPLANSEPDTAQKTLDSLSKKELVAIIVKWRAESTGHATRVRDARVRLGGRDLQNMTLPKLQHLARDLDIKVH